MADSENNSNSDLLLAKSLKLAHYVRSAEISQKALSVRLCTSLLSSRPGKKWPFIKPLKSDNSTLQCTLCTKALSGAHQGERDIVLELL